MSNSQETMTNFKRLIERNSTIPTNKSKDFTTAEDYQDRVDVSASLRRGNPIPSKQSPFEQKQQFHLTAVFLFSNRALFEHI